MNPFFFGPSSRPLFGVYSHGKGKAAGIGSVLLCYPIGSEYMRAHRAFRQLHNLLGRAGMNVLRFDYSCTGDSAGPGVEATTEGWLEDIDWAVDELKDNAMTDTVSVVGLRWGATLSARACSSRDDVDHLLLWDPILSGPAFLDDTLGHPRPTGLVGVEGFPYSPELVAGLEGFDLLEVLSGGLPARVTTLVAEERPEYANVARALDRRGRGEALEVVPSPGSWQEADPFGDALIPQDIIQAIVQRMSEGAVV